MTGSVYNDAVVDACKDKTIAKVELDGEVLRFLFTDGSKLSLSDEGHNCCESRYMTTDEPDFPYYEGSTFVGLEVRDAPDHSSEGDECHEAQFLVVKTNKGEFVMESHVEHNGFYGGICLSAHYQDPE